MPYFMIRHKVEVYVNPAHPVHGGFLIKRQLVSETNLYNVTATHNFLNPPVLASLCMANSQLDTKLQHY